VNVDERNDLPIDHAACGGAVERGQPAAGGAGWCLRFMGGAMKGRTVALARGTSVLGCAAGCDVMLPPGEALERHLVFEVGAVAATVRRVGDAAAWLNDEALGPERRGLVAGDALEVGSIAMQVDRTSAEVEEASDWGDSILPVDEAAPASAGHVHKAPAWRRHAAAVLLLAAAAGLGAGLVDRRPPDAGTSPRGLVELERALSDYPDVEIVVGAGGHVVLKGIVESASRKESLAGVVQAHGIRADLEVRAADDLVEQARQYLGAAGLSLSYAGGGRLVVSGTVEDESVRQRIRRLGEDLHPLVLVADKLEVRPRSAADKEAEQRAQWAAWQGLMPARIVSITEDAHGRRYLQLANGSRYYEGSVLRSGAELTHIGSDRLVVTGARPPAQGP
jgi:type III secretion protein D